jgi:hypothetical protein
MHPIASTGVCARCESPPTPAVPCGTITRLPSGPSYVSSLANGPASGPGDEKARWQNRRGLFHVFADQRLTYIQSGRPDSNRRRPAWEAGILPTELRPQDRA